MSGSETIRLIEAYNQQASPTMFLSGLFGTPARNFHQSEAVELDIIRTDEEIAIVITNVAAGPRYNSKNIYTNKKFIPPVFDEAVAFDSAELLKRAPGRNPFEDPAWRADIIAMLMDGMQDIERKIRRTIELQSAQVLTTGIISLTDPAGNVLYTINYVPKVTHFPAAGTAWNAGGADPIGDLNSLANVIRDDGLQDPDQIIMGEGSFELFVSDTNVQSRLDTRRIDLGTIAPMQMRGQGGQYRGTVELGTYKLDVWTYGGRHLQADGTTKAKYIADDKVIMRASGGRLDLTFGAVPNIGRELGLLPINIPELPSRFTNAAGGMDMFTNVYLSINGKQLFGEVAARPLAIPTAIDTFGCLDTGI